MTSTDLLTVLAILLAPLIAVQVQKRLEILRERRLRKVGVFEALMATRTARTSVEHVRALNMIDIEFRDKKILGYSSTSVPDRTVRDAWKLYLDHLNTQYTEEGFKVWCSRGDDLFVDLLHEMSTALGYDFDRVLLKKGCYSPIAHGFLELFQRKMQDRVLAVFTGRQPISVQVVDATSGPVEGRSPE